MAGPNITTTVFYLGTAAVFDSWANTGLTFMPGGAYQVASDKAATLVATGNFSYRASDNDPTAGIPAFTSSNVPSAATFGQGLMMVGTDLVSSDGVRTYKVGGKSCEVYVNAAQGYQGILDAASDLAATGGLIVLGPGTFTFPAGTSLQPASGVSLRGAGRAATTLTWENGHTANCITQPAYSTWSDFKFIAPGTITSDFAFKTAPVADGIYMTVTERIWGQGGSTSPAYTLSLMCFTSPQYCSASDIWCDNVASNGIIWLADPATAKWNFGNSVFSNFGVMLATGVTGKWVYRVEGQHQAAYNGIDADTSSDGTGSMDAMNLMLFNYMFGAIGAATSGNIGLWIVNSNRLQFNCVDFESVDTGIKIESVTAGGAPSSFANTFISAYCNGNATASVTIDASSFGNTFIGGQITGTITNSGASNRFINVRASSGSIDDYEQFQYLGSSNVSNTTGALIQPMRNASGGTLAAARLVRLTSATYDGGVTTTDNTAGVGAIWFGVNVASSAAGAIAKVARDGYQNILTSNIAARGDIMVVDTANPGQVKSNGTTMPTNWWEFVGICGYGAAAGAQCSVALHR